MQRWRISGGEVLRCWLPAACLALALGGAAPARAKEPAPRNWDKHPAIVEVDTPHAVYALGDVHGDYDRLCTLLVAAGLLEKVPQSPGEVPWKAGKAVLVCTGDLIDKGPKSVAVVTFFQALQLAAEKAGGRVVVTMGNHEADFLANPESDKVTDFREELTGQGIQFRDVAGGTDALGLGKFLRSLPLAARVNDWFFAHAGATRGRSLAQLRSELSDWVDAHGFLIEEKTSPLEPLLNARLNPYPWWQESDKEDADASRERLAKWVAALGVKHLVVGHQNNKVKFSDGSRREEGKVYAKFDGLIFLIDVGMSRQIDRSKGAVLHIHKGDEKKVTVLFPDGSEEKLWPE
jgi:hypothetical protein